jgi:hypothetical protein
MRGCVADEVEGDIAVDQVTQVIRRNQLFKGGHYQTVLVWGRQFEHARDSKHKAPNLWGLCQQSGATEAAPMDY